MSGVSEASPLHAIISDEFLLRRADFFDRQGEEYISSVAKDLRNAAAEIRRLRAENERLTKELAQSVKLKFVGRAKAQPMREDDW